MAQCLCEKNGEVRFINTDYGRAFQHHISKRITTTDAADHRAGNGVKKRSPVDYWITCSTARTFYIISLFSSIVQQGVVVD